MMAFAGYIMRGHTQAVLVALVAGLLSILFPPLGYVAGAALALVTLRKGPLTGLVDVAVTTAVMAIAIPLLLDSSTLFGLWYALGLWLPVWVMSVVLRRTISMPMTLLVAIGLGIAIVVAMYVLVADPAAWWRELLKSFLEQATKSGIELPDPAATGKVVETAAETMTGLVASVLIGGYIFCLLLARWWQSILYNPGGFREEILGLRLDRRVAIAVTLAMIAAMVNIGGTAPMFTEIVVLLLFLCSIFGVALIHDIVERRKLSALWLVSLYLASALLLPQVVILTGMIALMDSWVDLRRILGSPKG